MAYPLDLSLGLRGPSYRRAAELFELSTRPLAHPGATAAELAGLHGWNLWGAPNLPDNPSNRMDLWKGEVIAPTEQELLTGIQG